MEYILINKIKTLKCSMSHALTEICHENSVFESQCQKIEDMKPVYKTIEIFEEHGISISITHQTSDTGNSLQPGTIGSRFSCSKRNNSL